MRIILLILVLHLTQGSAIGQALINPEIRSSAVLVQFKNSSGSGFFLKDSSKVYLITAYHVLFDLQTHQPYEDTVSLMCYRQDVENDPKITLRVSIKEALSNHIKADPRNDLVAVRIASLLPVDKNGIGKIIYYPHTKHEGASTRLAFTPSEFFFKFNDVIAGSDIYIVGYPKSLGLQGNFDLDRPLFRKGIVAGKDVTYHRIIGDGAVYFGNSGGFVVGLADTVYRVIGIISQFIPFNDILLDTRGNIRSVDAKNSGYSVIIPGDKILELIKTF